MQKQVGKSLDWWIGELASALSPPGRAAAMWRGMLLRTDQGIEVLLRQGRAVQIVGRLSSEGGGDEGGRMAALLKSKGAVGEGLVLRLRPSDVIATEMTLPAAVRDVLAAVVRNKLEVVSPWPASQAVFAFEPRSDGPPETQLKVDVWIAGKAQVEQLLSGLASAGFDPGIVDAGAGAEEAQRFNLLGRAGDDLAGRRRRVAGVLKAIAAAVVLAVAGLGAYGYVLGGRLAEVQGLVEAQLRAQAAAARPRDAEAQRRWAQAIDKRNGVPSIAIAMEQLSRALPDDAHLERIEMRGGVLTLSGKAQSSAGLIARLEGVRHFEQVQFAAPTTRKEGDPREEFSLAVRVRPIMTLEPGEQP